MESFDQSFNTWLAPAGIVNSPEVVSARKAVALGLRDEDVSDYDLVMAAFGEVDDDVRGTVEQRLQEHDPTHAPGKKNLVELLCAAAVMSALERADEQATNLALLVKSGLFRNMKPRIKHLAESADQVLSAATARSRSRLGMKKPGARAQAAAAGEAADAAMVAALAARLEQAVAHFDAQLGLLNEEVDVLWWARSGRSQSGKSWSDMTELQRAIIATAEVSGFIADVPITGAVFEVLRGIADGPKRKTASFAEVTELAAAQPQLVTIDSAYWLLPLLTGVRIARTYPPDARTGVASAELSIDTTAAYKIVDLPEQLMREVAIVKRVL